jgi:hypothetical protein
MSNKYSKDDLILLLTESIQEIFTLKNDIAQLKEKQIELNSLNDESLRQMRVFKNEISESKQVLINLVKQEIDDHFISRLNEINKPQLKKSWFHK